jgi:hypothetical protein
MMCLLWKKRAFEKQASRERWRLDETFNPEAEPFVRMARDLKGKAASQRKGSSGYRAGDDVRFV